MFRLDLSADDWGLLLTPRFAGLGSPWQGVAVAALILVPCLLLLWLYRYELRLVRRVMALALLTLRLGLVALLWFVACWQPILARSEVETVPGRLLVAVDVSASMDIPDPQRSPLEKLLLARALRLQPRTTLPFESLLDQWIKHYQENGGGVPPWTNSSDQGDSAERERLADARRKLHDELCALVDGLTRRDVVQRILSPQGMNLVARLKKHHQVQVVAFDEGVLEMQNGQSVASADPQRMTDLSQPLTRALEAASKSQGNFQGVLLLTDGRHNRGDSPEARAKECKDRHMPIYPVAIGGKLPPPDLAVTKVSAPHSVLVKAPAEVSADIKVSGLPPQEIVVELHRAGQGQPEKQIIKHTGGDSRVYSVHFTTQMDKVGTHEVAIKVRPASPEVKEITEKNNAQRALVRVVEDRAKVLLVDDEARWEYQYLANALVRDEAVKLDRVLFTPPRVGAIGPADLKAAGLPAKELPPWQKGGKKADPLLQYQCIILGDLPPEKLTPADRNRLARFVAEQGGTLVLVAGPQAMPLAYAQSQPGGDTADALGKLLPLGQLRVIEPKEGFRLTLTPEGAQSPYLQLDDTKESSAQIWSKLPRHDWAVIGKAKPAATVLAHVMPGAAGEGLPPTAGKGEPARDDALIVAQTYGLGRVIYVGLDSTWRWRFRKGDLYHYRFWGQLILWAASNQFLPGGNALVRYGTRQPLYAAEETVEILLRLEDAAPLLPGDASIQVRLLRQKDDGTEEAVAVVPLTAEGGSPTLFKGTAKGVPAGTYRLEPVIPLLADRLKEMDRQPAANGGDRFVVLPAESKELANVAVDWLLLDQLAQLSGAGPQALTPDQLDELLRSLSARQNTREQHEERRPWHDPPLTWYLLAAFLTLLTVEWSLRKMAALP